MIFGKRIRYKLPKFPQSVIPTFRRYCEPVPVEEIPEILAILNHNAEDIRTRAYQNVNIDPTKVDKIATACRIMLAEYETLDDIGRGLVIGAIRYFIRPDDPVSDHKFASGFDDDVQIINHVLEQVGIDGYFIEM